MDCYHVLKLRSERPANVSREGGLCEKCEQHNKGALQATSNARWTDAVLGAIQAVRAKDSQENPIGEVSLWDLFDLDDTPRWGRPSDLGEALGLLDAKTQARLIKWLDENVEEAVGRYGELRCHCLYAIVRVSARLADLPSDMSLVPEDYEPEGSLVTIAYTRSGRFVDQAVVIRLARLRQAKRHFTERDLEKALGVPRSTLKHMMRRMDEIGFSLERFTSNDLSYVIRGPKHES